MRRTKDAAVGRQAGKNDRGSAELPQQQVERRLIKGRVHGLQDEVVLVVGPEPFLPAAAKAMGIDALRVIETGEPILLGNVLPGSEPENAAAGQRPG